MAGMKPARTTRTAWLWRSNNSHCGRLRLASETCRTLALARLAGSAGSAGGIRGASQRPAPEGNGLPASGRQVPLANGRRHGGDCRRGRCDHRAGRGFYASACEANREGALSRIGRSSGGAIPGGCRSHHQRNCRGIQLRSKSVVAQECARADATVAGNGGAAGSAKHLRPAGKHRRGDALPARTAAEVQQRPGADAGRLQCGARAGSAIRPRTALSGDALVRAPRQAQLRQEQVESFHENACYAWSRSDSRVFPAPRGAVSIELLLRRRLLRIRLRRGGILSEWHAGTPALPALLAQSRSRLQAWLSHSESVLRGIPDELEKVIVPGFIVDDNRRLADLAADPDDIATDDRGSIAGRGSLRIGSRVALVGPYGSSGSGRWICAGCCTGRRSTKALLTNRAGLCRGAKSVQCIPAVADSAGLEKLNILPGFEASNQLAGGPYIDKPPGTIFFVHGVFVGLAHEAE